MRLYMLKHPKDMTPGERQVRRETMWQMSIGIVIGATLAFLLILWLING